MSLSAAQNSIEQALKDTGRFSQVAVWSGDVQTLLDAPKQIPAAFIILSGVDYDLPLTIGTPAAKAESLWSLIVFEYVNKSIDGEIAAYQAIETTVAALTNLRIDNRRLWPAQTRLLGAVKNSVSSYGIQFQLL